jgi:hypothetical protein
LVIHMTPVERTHPTPIVIYGCSPGIGEKNSLPKGIRDRTPRASFRVLDSRGNKRPQLCTLFHGKIINILILLMQ